MTTEAATTPELIAHHARVLFEDHGFAGTSVRVIAAAAGIDPALVIRHFGSKEALFLDVIGLEGYVDPPIDGPVESLGHRLVAFVQAPEHADFRSRLTTLVRASDREAVREGLRLTVRRMFIDRLVQVLDGDDRELRAQLISAQLGGLVQSSASIEADLEGSADHDRVVELYGRAVQALATPR